MTATARAGTGANGPPDLRPYPADHPDAAEHGTVRFAVTINGVRYHLRPLDCQGTQFNALVRLLPQAGAFAAVEVCEWTDPELGLADPKYLGLGCTCAVGDSGLACTHVRALAAVGLLRPAPGWDEDDVALDQTLWLVLDQDGDGESAGGEP